MRAAGRQFPTAEEVERVREVLTSSPQTSNVLGTKAGVRGDRVGIALRTLKHRGIATAQGSRPQLWSLRRGTA